MAKTQKVLHVLFVIQAAPPLELADVEEAFVDD